jgi:penicillin-binding protein 2
MHDVTVFGTSYFIKVPGQEYCAKTGTAQNPHGKNHSWFVAFAPKDDPKIAVAVVVENAGYGATWAGPIAGFMMEKYLNDTIATDRLAEVERISKADLVPAAIKHWYYVKDSLRQAKAREIDENAVETPAKTETKTTFDPEAEPNKKQTTDTPRNQLLMLKPEEIRIKKD